jgi:hypothetical protein
MSATTGQREFKVNILVQAAGPVRPRTKCKKHKLLRAERSITLSFVPYPGLHLTFSKPRKHGQSLALYLRVRAVEWSVADDRFECVADEILGSSLFSETYEVRGGARIEKHFADLQKTLRVFGFDVTTDADGMMALHKCEDGTVIDGMGPIRHYSQ